MPIRSCPVLYHSALLAPLDDAITGRKSQDPVPWTDEIRSSFYEAQSAISKSRTITLPRPDDQLWIVTDGAVRNPGIGATLYVTRGQKLHLAGFFSAKLRGTQSLSTAVATRHFSPFLIQSQHKACILTDSKPCVQAYEKLCRGEFSTSPRLSTFLSTVSRYQASVRHVAGSAILPLDFASRNAPACEDQSCQVCSFVQRLEESVVRRVCIQHVLNGREKLPFTSRPAWLSIQSECADLRRTHTHLKQGTRPSKKLNNIKDVKRYLNVATIARDGLLVVKRTDPLCPPPGVYNRSTCSLRRPPDCVTYPAMSPFWPSTEVCSEEVPFCLRYGQRNRPHRAGFWHRRYRRPPRAPSAGGAPPAPVTLGKKK